MPSAPRSTAVTFGSPIQHGRLPLITVLFPATSFTVRFSYDVQPLNIYIIIVIVLQYYYIEWLNTCVNVHLF